MGLSRFQDLSKEDKMKLTFDDFTVSEIRYIIEETVLTESDQRIAELRFIKKLSIERIAEVMGYDKKTIFLHGNAIKEKLLKTIQKILL